MHAGLLVVVVLVSAVLGLARLDGRFLWEDEAETALLAQRILDVGLPIARDGRNVISQGCGLDADENYLWTFHPWLPMYVVAGSFKLLGVSATAARLPFALLGVLSVVSLYAAGRRIFRDPALALIAAAFLAASVPFWLHARQARYYAVAVFAAVWMLAFLPPAAAGGRLATVGLVAASTVMLHANHAMFAATFLALSAAFVLFERDVRGLGRLAVAGLLTLVLNAAWLAIYGGAWVGAAFGAQDRTVRAALKTFGTGLVWYLEHVDLYLFPFPLVLLFIVWLVVERRVAARRSTALVAESPSGAADTKPAPDTGAAWNPAALRRAGELAAFSLIYLAGVSLLPYSSTRFMLNVLPALALVQAYIVRTIGARRPIVAALLFVLLAGTNVLHGSAERLTGKTPSPWPAPTLANFARELTEDLDGAVAATVRHLRAHARPGDRVFITYGDLPLRFATSLAVRGGVTCEPPPATPPEWIVARYFFRFVHPAPGTSADLERMRRYMNTEVPWKRYERIELPVVDTVWENNPEPRWHHYHTPGQGPHVVIYRLIHDQQH